MRNNTQNKNQILFQTAQDLKKAKFDNLWHEGFKMTPLQNDTGDTPSNVVYMYAGNSQYVWSEGQRIVSYDDSIDTQEALMSTKQFRT